MITVMKVMRDLPAEIWRPQRGVGDLGTLGKHASAVSDNDAYKSDYIANPFALRESTMSTLLES